MVLVTGEAAHAQEAGLCGESLYLPLHLPGTLNFSKQKQSIFLKKQSSQVGITHQWNVFPAHILFTTWPIYVTYLAQSFIFSFASLQKRKEAGVESDHTPLLMAQWTVDPSFSQCQSCACSMKFHLTEPSLSTLWGPQKGRWTDWSNVTTDPQRGKQRILKCKLLYCGQI